MLFWFAGSFFGLWVAFWLAGRFFSWRVAFWLAGSFFGWRGACLGLWVACLGWQLAFLVGGLFFWLAGSGFLFQDVSCPMKYVFFLSFYEFCPYWVRDLEHFLLICGTTF